jgi:hypothetical protein
MASKAVIHGVIGGAALFVVYLVLLTVANSFEHALEQLAGMWYWIAALVAGFGVQISLYSNVRSEFHARKVAGATGSVAAAGGVSTGSMVACCLHHFTDVLPILGFSAAALFLSQYQDAFLLLGVLSNLTGITIMLSLMQRYGMMEKGFFRRLGGINMKKLRNLTAVVSVILFSLVLVFSSGVLQPQAASVQFQEPSAGDIAGNDKTLDLQTITNDENSVTVEVTPLNFEYGKPVVFDVALNTHSVSLDFNVDEISLLRDGLGNANNALRWEGTPPGGHHRNGRLTFPSVPEGAGYIELVLEGISNIPERVFKWSLE